MGVKEVENRTWKTHFRGRIYIHACGWKRNSLNYQLTPAQNEVVSRYPLIKLLLAEKDKMCSAIIGHVDLLDIVEDSSSVWVLKDHYHWKLENTVLFERTVINVKGQLNFWDCREYVINGKF